MYVRLRASGSKVRCFSLHPGCVRTEVTRNMSAFMRIGNAMAEPIMRTLQKTPEQGAYTSVHVATSPLLDGPDYQDGGYFENCRKAEPSPAATDSGAAQALWTASEALTGLAKQ